MLIDNIIAHTGGINPHRSTGRLIILSEAECHFFLEFHPSPWAFDPGNPATRPLFLKFQPVCVKYGQLVERLTKSKISGSKGSNYEKDMDLVFGQQGR